MGLLDIVLGILGTQVVQGVFFNGPTQKSSKYEIGPTQQDKMAKYTGPTLSYKNVRVVNKQMEGVGVEWWTGQPTALIFLLLTTGFMVTFK